MTTGERDVEEETAHEVEIACFRRGPLAQDVASWILVRVFSKGLRLDSRRSLQGKFRMVLRLSEGLANISKAECEGMCLWHVCMLVYTNWQPLGPGRRAAKGNLSVIVLSCLGAQR